MSIPSFESCIIASYGTRSGIVSMVLYSYFMHSLIFLKFCSIFVLSIHKFRIILAGLLFCSCLYISSFGGVYSFWNIRSGTPNKNATVDTIVYVTFVGSDAESCSCAFTPNISVIALSFLKNNLKLKHYSNYLFSSLFLNIDDFSPLLNKKAQS